MILLFPFWSFPPIVALSTTPMQPAKRWRQTRLCFPLKRALTESGEEEKNFNSHGNKVASQVDQAPAEEASSCPPICHHWILWVRGRCCCY
jgi:hypothetical protein